MKQKEEAPGRLEPSQGQNDFSTCVCGGKYTKCICKNLSKREKKVLELLISGKHSVTEITMKTGFSDPRHYVRMLRQKGIPVHDEWVHPSSETKFKTFYVGQKKAHTHIANVKSVGEIIQANFMDLFERRPSYD